MGLFFKGVVSRKNLQFWRFFQNRDFPTKKAPLRGLFGRPRDLNGYHGPQFLEALGLPGRPTRAARGKNGPKRGHFLEEAFYSFSGHLLPKPFCRIWSQILGSGRGGFRPPAWRPPADPSRLLVEPVGMDLGPSGPNGYRKGIIGHF